MHIIYTIYKYIYIYIYILYIKYVHYIMDMDVCNSCKSKLNIIKLYKKVNYILSGEVMEFV